MVVHWQTLALSAFPAPDDRLAGWLLNPHSFMQRLKQAGIRAARVQVIKQRWEFPNRQDAAYLGLEPRRYALVREVLIASKENPWMFARTVIPRATLTGREQLLARLKNRAIGTMLFNNPRVRRSDFEFAQVNKAQQDYKKIWQHCDLETPELWARRSVFYLPEKKLSLTEVFFPTLMELTT
jgi:chorismate--pyruvate lyase